MDEQTGTRPVTLETSRLSLVVLLPEEIRALIAGDAQGASRSAGVVFPSGWPDAADVREGLPWHLRHIERNPSHRPWRIRVVVDRTDCSVIGSINLKGPPDKTGDIEIGWGITESRRRQGYALEASCAVIVWALREAPVRTISATIADENEASQRLAVKLGLVRSDERRLGMPLWVRPAGQP